MKKIIFAICTMILKLCNITSNVQGICYILKLCNITSNVQGICYENCTVMLWKKSYIFIVLIYVEYKICLTCMAFLICGP